MERWGKGRGRVYFFAVWAGACFFVLAVWAVPPPPPKQQKNDTAQSTKKQKAQTTNKTRQQRNKHCYQDALDVLYSFFCNMRHVFACVNCPVHPTTPKKVLRPHTGWHLLSRQLRATVDLIPHHAHRELHSKMEARKQHLCLRTYMNILHVDVMRSDERGLLHHENNESPFRYPL